MKRYLVFTACAIFPILLVFVIFHTGDREIRNYPSSGKDIIAFGDSLVSGLGSEKGGGFVTPLLEKIAGKTEGEIVNLGNAGDTTEDALARVDEIFRYDPKVVIILLGGNDFLRRIPKETAFQNLDAIMARVEGKGAIVLLLGVRGAFFGDNAEEYYADLAERRGAAYVPNILDGIFGHSDLMYDRIHPNDQGYEMIAERVYPALVELLQ